MPIDPVTLAGVGRALKSGPQGSGAGAASGATGVTGEGFSGTLGRLISGVEQSEAEANSAVSGMLDKTTDVHDAMIALQRSELTFELTMQIRNKFVSAYQEIMRMPI